MMNRYVPLALIFFIAFVNAGRAGAADISQCADLSKRGETAYHSANYDAAVKEFTSARKCYLTVSGGKETADTSACLNNIGLMYQNKGAFVLALQNYNRALNISLKVFGEEDTATATDYSNIGSIYSHMGDYANALAYNEKALRIRLNKLGEVNSETATSYNNIGSVYRDKGDCVRALEFYGRALEIDLKIYGREHPDTAAIYNNIGLAYGDKGDYEKALENHSLALKIRLNTLGDKHPDTAVSYNNLGGVYKERGDYGLSLENYTKALNIDLSVLGEMHPDTALEYINVGGVYLEKGDYDKALENYNRALVIDLKVLGEEHPHTAITYVNIGMALSGRGNFDGALEYFNRALSIFSKLYGEQNSYVAITYNNIGAVYGEKSDYDMALKYYELALNIELGIYGEEHPSTADSYLNIGTVYGYKGDYEHAMKNFKKALSTYLKVYGEEHYKTATGYKSIGVLYQEKGDYEAALEIFSRALKIDLKVFGEETPSAASDYDHIGMVYKDEGYFDEALKNINLALKIRLKILGEGHPDTATSYNNAGEVLESRGDHDGALDNFKRSLEIRLKVFGEMHTDTAISYNNIGAVYSNKGEFEKALENHNLALKIRRNIFGEEHTATAQSYNNIGMVYRDKGDYEDELAYHRKALKSLCGGKENPVAKDCRPVFGTVGAFMVIGLTEIKLGRFADAATAFENGADSLEMRRGGMLSEESKKIQSGSFYEIFPAGVGAFASLHDQTKDTTALERALVFAEKGIGRVFLEMIGRSQAVFSGGLPDDVVQEGVILNKRWTEANDEVAKVQSKPNDNQSQSARTAAIEKLQRAYGDLQAYETRLLKDYPAYAELMHPQTRSLAEIRDKVIAPDEAALEYILGEDGSYLIFITKDKIAIKALAGSGKIEGNVELFRKLLTSGNGEAGKLLRKGADLYEMLIKPVEDELTGIKKLLIVPTGELYFLPFEALTSGGESVVNFLIEKYDIRYAPSLNVLYLVSDRVDKEGGMRKGEKKWLGFGDPVYDDPADERAYGPGAAAEANPEQTRGMADSLRGGASDCYNGEEAASGHWKRLKSTGTEAEEVSALFKDNAVVYTGFDASEDKFKESMKTGAYRYLHVGAHGTVKLAPGSEPAIIFSLLHPAGKSVSDDGYLTMSEVFNMKVPVDMAVLSACMTGCGAQEKGEGVAGLSRAFLYAGADSLVVSLWSVADVQTKELMVDFYTMLKGGMNRESALREAKIDMIKQGKLPFFWAPFVYIGVN